LEKGNPKIMMKGKNIGKIQNFANVTS